MKIYISRLLSGTVNLFRRGGRGQPFKVLYGINIDVRNQDDITVEPVYFAPIEVWTVGNALFVRFGLKGVLVLRFGIPPFEWLEPTGIQLEDE